MLRIRKSRSGNTTNIVAKGLIAADDDATDEVDAPRGRSSKNIRRRRPVIAGNCVWKGRGVDGRVVCCAINNTFELVYIGQAPGLACKSQVVAVAEGSCPVGCCG